MTFVRTVTSRVARARALLLALLLAWSAAAPGALAQPADADEKELLAYRLTMPKVRQMAQVYTSIVKTAAADPKMQALERARREYAALQDKEEPTEADDRRLEQLQGEIEQLEDQVDGAINLSEARSIDDMVTRIDAQPAMSAAIRGAGLSTREFAMMQLALFQAMLAQGVVKAGAKTLPAGVNPDNVAFIQAHQDEIAAMMKAVQAPLGAGKP